tara:strand:+ start:119 stop:706 length:588 start_codon:yes stop_codon:yes gene_type:complete
MHNPFTDEQNEKINTFINTALEFNKTHNIFSRENNQEVFQKDILDCYPINQYLEKDKTVLDLGSGGGFPGILLSITKPDNKIYLIESSSKKCYFLRTIVDKLSLNNTTIINEKMKTKNALGKFDIITARAFASIKNIIDLTQNNTNNKFKYVLLKGREKTIKQELKDINKNKHIYEIIKQRVGPEERHLVLIEEK